MQWFRLYQSVVNDPKVQRLAARLFRTWVNLLCLASENSERGTLPSLEDMAFRLRTSPKSTTIDLEDLIAAGLIDRDGDTLRMHDWDDWQYETDSSTPRVQKHRERKRQRAEDETFQQRSEGATETPPETDQKKSRKDETTEEKQQQGRIFRLCEDLCGSVNAATANLLLELETRYPEECVDHCFTEAASSGGRTLKYVTAILERHAQEGCPSENGGPPLRDPQIEWLERRFREGEKRKEAGES